jgi:transposase
MMLSQGIHAAKGWWKKQAWSKLSEQLPGWLKEQLEWWHHQACEHDQALRKLSAQVEEQAEHAIMPKGIGLLTTGLLSAEILDWSRFRNRRQVASYAGVCPSEHSSGKRKRQGSINKHGNPRVRRLLIEASWRLMRYQPGYPPLKKLEQASGCRARKKAIVAIARRLVVDLWRIHTRQCTAAQLGLSMGVE